jgi:cytoskeleton protein RodZ
MSDEVAAAGPAAATAGRLLREARERQGLHIVALSAMIKVAPKKLELLEADRIDALPDATFARALAQTVCRALKIDATPVLSLLPLSGHRLEQVGRTLNTPFQDRPGALVQREGPSLATSPAFWITGLILLAAVTVYLLPAGLIRTAASRVPAASAPDPRTNEVPGMPPDSSVGTTTPAPVGPNTLAAPASPQPGETPGEPPSTDAVSVPGAASAVPSGPGRGIPQ